MTATSGGLMFSMKTPRWPAYVHESRSRPIGLHCKFTAEPRVYSINLEILISLPVVKVNITFSSPAS